MKLIWTDPYKVHSYEIDEFSNASFTAICNFMQETAWNHAEHLQVGYSHLIKDGLVWVLSRQHIKVHQYPRWGDDILVNTWPSGRERMYFYRDFRIESPDHATLVTATSTWFVINMNSRRPQRAETYFNMDIGNPEQMFTTFADKLASFEGSDANFERTIMFSDTDVNGHLNNINYMKYIVDSMPRDFLEANRMMELEINYLNEGMYGDTVRIQRQENDGGEILFSIGRLGSGEEMCRARTQWKSVD